MDEEVWMGEDSLTEGIMPAGVCSICCFPAALLVCAHKLVAFFCCMFCPHSSIIYIFIFGILFTSERLFKPSSMVLTFLTVAKTEHVWS